MPLSTTSRTNPIKSNGQIEASLRSTAPEHGPCATPRAARETTALAHTMQPVPKSMSEYPYSSVFACDRGKIEGKSTARITMQVVIMITARYSATNLNLVPAASMWVKPGAYTPSFLTARVARMRISRRGHASTFSRSATNAAHTQTRFAMANHAVCGVAKAMVSGSTAHPNSPTSFAGHLLKCLSAASAINCWKHTVPG
mmetsp:Transcript_85115/g.244303  ORF Transcript_85115/g.244303 Transcript_85115/m.244303 type:complete len:200 (-) Transcript_85115:283-882(-)